MSTEIEVKRKFHCLCSRCRTRALGGIFPIPRTMRGHMRNGSLASSRRQRPEAGGFLAILLLLMSRVREQSAQLSVDLQTKQFRIRRSVVVIVDHVSKVRLAVVFHDCFRICVASMHRSGFSCCNQIMSRIDVVERNRSRFVLFERVNRSFENWLRLFERLGLVVRRHFQVV